MFVLNFALLFLASSIAASKEGPVTVLKLNDGRDFPGLGLGTWLGFKKSGGREDLKGNEIEEAVAAAIDAGYRHVDTAAIYSTETQVGNAIRKKIEEGVIKREDIFVTTKLWNDRHSKDSVVPALNESLSRLGLEYVDLYLIHWPVALNADGSLSDTDYVETWTGMVEARDRGLARSIGVSNFNQHQLERLISLSPVKPAVLQVEVNLNLQQPSLLAYCRSQEIVVTGYTPFGSLFHSKAAEDAPPPRVDDPALLNIAKNHNKTVTQINLRYLVELGVVPIPKSITKSRILENIDVFDFTLTQPEKDLMKSYDRGYRTIPVKHWIKSVNYPFEK